LVENISTFIFAVLALEVFSGYIQTPLKDWKQVALVDKVLSEKI